MDLGPRRLIQQNFDVIAPQAVVFGADFYDRLFRAAPDLRGIFPPDMAPQVRKLIETLTALISHLAHPEALRTELHRLGALHADIGVRPDDYDLVAEALVETLRAWLGPAFTPACEEAWTTALSTVSQLMLEGAEMARVTGRCLRAES